MLDAFKKLIVAIPKYVVSRTITSIDTDLSHNMYLKARDGIFKITKDTFFSLVNLLKRPKSVQAGEIVEASQAQLSPTLQTSPTLTSSQGGIAFLVVMVFIALFLVGLWLCQPEDNQENDETA